MPGTVGVQLAIALIPSRWKLMKKKVVGQQREDEDRKEGNNFGRAHL